MTYYVSSGTLSLYTTTTTTLTQQISELRCEQVITLPAILAHLSVLQHFDASLQQVARHHTFWLSVCVSIQWSRHFINRLGSFTKFTTLLRLGTETNWLDIEVKRSKVKATTRPNMVKKGRDMHQRLPITSTYWWHWGGRGFKGQGQPVVTKRNLHTSGRELWTRSGRSWVQRSAS